MSIPDSLRVVVLLIPLTLTACSGLLESNEPADRVYRLASFVMDATSEDASSYPSLQVTITAAPGMDTDRLLVLEGDARLNHYAAARWPDNAPEVLGSALRTTLQSVGTFSRVNHAASAHGADWLLELEIRELFVESNTVRWNLGGYVSCHGADRPVSLRSSVATDDSSLRLIVAAHQKALDEVSGKLADELADICEPPADSVSGR